jgi:hypothetical protein
LDNLPNNLVGSGYGMGFPRRGREPVKLEPREKVERPNPGEASPRRRPAGESLRGNRDIAGLNGIFHQIHISLHIQFLHEIPAVIVYG